MATVESEKITPSKISSSHQILFTELISIVEETMIKIFTLGQHKLLLKKDSEITTGISIIDNTLKAQSYPSTSGR